MTDSKVLLLHLGKGCYFDRTSGVYIQMYLPVVKGGISLIAYPVNSREKVDNLRILRTRPYIDDRLASRHDSTRIPTHALHARIPR